MPNLPPNPDQFGENITEDATPTEVADVPAAPEVSNLPNQSILGQSIVFTETGPKIEMLITDDERTIQVNTKKFPTPAAALRAAATQAAYLAEFQSQISQNSQAFLETASQSDQKILNQVLRLRGLQKLKIQDPEISAQISATTPKELGLTAQFDLAVEQYILTGSIPPNFSPPVTSAFEEIQKLQKSGKNSLDFLTEENRSPRSAIDLYQKYLAPLRANIHKAEVRTRETERDDYTPPNFQGETEPLDPESVRYKVDPYLGGYYRQQIFRFDPAEQCLVARPTTKTTFIPENLPATLEGQKIYAFKGTYQPGEENNLPLPYHALPLPHTLTPAHQFTLMRSTNGIFSIDEKSSASRENDLAPLRPSASTPFEFSFILQKSPATELDDEPQAEDLFTLPGDIDEATQTFLNNLQQNTFLSPLDQARAIVNYTKSALIYPEEEEVQAMNELYKSSGNNLLTTIATHKIADCHWSNIFAAELGKRIGIHWRNPAGFFVQKIPDCEFAAIGGIGHAWSEIWDEKNQQWIKSDATPSKRKKDDEEEGEKTGEGQAEQGDLEETEQLSDEEKDIEESGVLNLTPEQMQKLAKELETVKPPTEQQVAAAVFRERTGVTLKDWQEVEKFIKEVNKTPVPTATQIPENTPVVKAFLDQLTAPRGTLEREWQKLFLLICKHRKISVKAFRGPVRQSEGTRLRDPVDAYIDIMANDPDPGGFEMEATKTKNRLEVHEFEEDAIIDLTSSMEATDQFGNSMKNEQKKMILSLLYHIMKLNERLNDSRTKANLTEPLEIRSTIHSIHGDSRTNKGKYSCLKPATESITEKVLVHLSRELSQTSPGAGDLVSALKAYAASITPQLAAKLKAKKTVKLLTIYSDGNMWCSQCSQESCSVAMHRASIKAAQEEVKKLREMGVIVQGIGFTQSGEAIKLICADPSDPDSAAIVDDVSKAAAARHKMLAKHLQKL